MKRVRWLMQVVLGVALCWAAMVAATRLALSEPPPSGASLLGTAKSTDPVVRYVLEARLDEEQHLVHGKGRVTWRNVSSKPQSSIFLHLYLNAFANEKTVFMRKRLPGFRGGQYPERWGRIDVERIVISATGVDLWEEATKHTKGDPDDATDIELELPEAIAPGETLELTMEWVSRLPSVTHRTGFSRSFHMVAQWFPKLARLEPDGEWAHFPFHRLSEFYADFGDYDVTIDVPSRFTVGATGPRLSDLDDGERKRVRHRIERVHDFAFTAWDGFAELTDEGPGGVAMRCLYPAGLDRLAEVEMGEAKAALESLSGAYGRYPYGTLTIVHPPRHAVDAGGMEYPTLITTGGSWLGLELGAKAIHAVTVHELAHQWFYGLVATNEFRWPFLDEGLTTFSSTHALEERYPGTSAYEGLGLSLSLWAITRAGAARSYDRGRVSRRADEFESGRDYGGLVYAKTATLLETLRRVYGDELLEAVGAYAKEQRFGHPTPADLLTAIESAVGRGAARNLRVGLLEGGWVDYRVLDLEEDADEVTAIRQGALAFDVEVAIHRTDGSVDRRSWPASERVFQVPAAGVEAVVVDPELRVLIDHDLTNNARRLGNASMAPRVWSQLSLVTQVAATVVAP